ncbi:hypothetical protein [uncultured Solobacterium sp.]|jgi:membrane protein|uniref:hypothetical protein n=1 Tax=uncultured Solobacterium sp. TaxID=747375 RepID=UPI001CB63CE3|nr:hypothetical protein [uncultured Solobacterium sp.]MBF1107406.1 hypothetical protein [Solobacterium sp.]
MKALLLLEFETFIKKKQYIFPLLYIVYSICSLVYTVKVKANNENILMVILSIQLICEFAKREQPMKRIVRLFPVSAKERINTLFVETFILNAIVLVGLSISFFPFHGMGMLWGILNIVVFVETLEIPAILSIVMWHRNYFQHLLMMLIVIGMSVLVYIKTDIHPVIQFLGYATVLYTLAYISSIRILTNKDW